MNGEFGWFVLKNIYNIEDDNLKIDIFWLWQTTWQKHSSCDGSRGRSMAERSYPTSEVRGGGREELSYIWGHGRWPRGATPHPRSGVASGKSNPVSKVRGGGQEEQPHIQGAVGAVAQEGQEELLHIQGQEGRRWEDIPRPK